MANLGVNDNGARRCWFWNLAPPTRFRLSWLYLDRFISLAWAAIRSVVYRSGQGSVRCHTSLEFTMATSSLVNRLPPRCCGLRCRSLLVAVVARAVAGWSCFRSFRLACIGSSIYQGNSISQKVYCLMTAHVGTRHDLSGLRVNQAVEFLGVSNCGR